jgi:CHASE2 domain-containing sensor protein
MPSFFDSALKSIKLFYRKSSKWPVGYVMIGGFIALRWLGLFSHLELLTLDLFLRNRPLEKTDEKIVLVLFERDAIQGQPDFSDKQLADLLEIIFSADPAVVGFNVFRPEESDEAGRQRLVDVFEKHPNLVGIQKVVKPGEIPPMADLPSEVIDHQIGITDIPIDLDGRIRRVFIGAYLEGATQDPQDNVFKLSFSFKLAEQYLVSSGYVLDNHAKNPETPIFTHPSQAKNTPIPILMPALGGYLKDPNVSKLQTILNFRTGPEAFEIVSAFKLLHGFQSPKMLSDKVVIVGGFDPLFTRLLPAAATSGLVSGEENTDGADILPSVGIIGPEFEAHATSQIINAVINNRPLIWVLPTWSETLLIVLSGLTGIAISISLKSTARSAIALVLFTCLAITICYLSVYRFGLWLPIMPMIVCLPLAGITYLGFNYHSQRNTLQSQKEQLVEAQILEAERRKAIERAFSAIHAGPLQRLSSLLRHTKDGHTEQDFILGELRALNKEIRGIGERLRQEAIGDVYFVYSEGDIKLDLTHPMHEVLYEVYSLAVQRKLPGFAEVKIRTVSIEPFNCHQLSVDIKRQLCWFLEESLHNIGKHADGTTRIKVSGKNIDGFYVLKVEDNGSGIQSPHIGDGTQSFYRLEAMLRGKFSRFSKPKGGTVCELCWPSNGTLA